MRDKIISALVKLTLCPGKFDPESDICSRCVYNKSEEPVEDCGSILRRDCTELLEKAEDPVASHNPGVSKRVTQILKTVGVPSHLKGYQYLKEAIAVVIEDPSMLERITKGLYPQVAKTFQTTPSRVERGIRHAIEVAWDRGDLDTLQRFFGYMVSNTKGKPTNSEFISCLAEYIQMGEDAC